MSFQTHSISIQLAQILCLFLSVLPANSSVDVDNQAYDLSGELKKWHTIKVDFIGPDTSETTANPIAADCPGSIGGEGEGYPYKCLRVRLLGSSTFREFPLSLLHHTIFALSRAAKICQKDA